MDFPLPEGPRTATHSPFSKLKLTPLITWFFPKDLWRSLIVITATKPFFYMFYDRGNEINDDEIKEGGDSHRDEVASHIFAGTNVFGGHSEVKHANHTNNGGFLDEGDNFVADGRNAVFDGLRSNDFCHNSVIREA